MQSTGDRLEKWAKAMGYTPPEGQDYPSVETFEKICRGKTCELWFGITKSVKSKEEVLHIQKNLILKRLKAGSLPEKDAVSGHLCQQLILESQLKAKQKTQKKLLDSIHLTETSIQTREKSLRKSGHKVIDLEQQIDELKKKQILFKLKVNKCRFTLRLFKQINTVAIDLHPPPPGAKPEIALVSAVATLTDCTNALTNFYSKSIDTNLTVVDSGSRDMHLKHLWEYITSKTAGWGAQQLWNTITSNLMAEILDEVSNSDASGNLFGNGSKLRSDESRTQIENALTILPAIYLTSVLENINLDVRIRIKAAELQNLQAKCITKINACLSSENMNSFQSSMSTKGLIKVWVEAQFRKAGLAAKLKDVKNELERMKENKPSIITASSQLNAAKEELSKLNLLIDHDKRLVEENIALINMVGNRLEMARAKVLQQRKVFNASSESHPLFKQCIVGQSPEMDPYSSSFVLSGDSNSPERKNPLSSTMIGNMTADSVLSFDTTASVCDLEAGKFGSHSNLPEIITVLKESISKEAKLFFKLPLKTIPFIIDSGNLRVSVCKLMVQAPMMMPSIVNSSQRHLLQCVQGTPHLSAPQIILNQVHTLNHIRALSIHKLLFENSSPVLLDVQKMLHTLMQLSPSQQEALQGQVEGLRAIIEDIKILLSTCQTNMDFWLQRPIQKAIPPSLTVSGRSFSDWCKQYDDLHQVKN